MASETEGASVVLQYRRLRGLDWHHLLSRPGFREFQPTDDARAVLDGMSHARAIVALAAVRAFVLTDGQEPEIYSVVDANAGTHGSNEISMDVLEPDLLVLATAILEYSSLGGPRVEGAPPSFPPDTSSAR